jgi:hypothetical protein
MGLLENARRLSGTVRLTFTSPSRRTRCIASQQLGVRLRGEKSNEFETPNRNPE